MQIYIAAAPEEARAASAYGHSLAHTAYYIGTSSTLLRRNPLLQSGGLLSVRDDNAPEVSAPDALCAAVLRECSRRNYAGVLLDFEHPPRRDLLAFAAQLEPALSTRNRILFLPETYAHAAPQAMVLLGTAVSGGTLEERLRDAAEQYGKRIALDVERLRMDFRLPCPSGIGTPLSANAFSLLLQQERPTCFFSPALCARYFTYQRSGETHFVLFDDKETLHRKLKLGQQFGAAVAFFMWSEISDIAADLLERL